MQAKLGEIARRAGVSVATASRALNGSASVRPETRERVLAVATELRYTPNMSARSLVTSRTNTIGYVSFRKCYTTEADPFYPHIAHGIEAELQRHSYHLLVTTIDDKQSRDASSFRLVAERRVDGLIVLPHAPQRFVLQLKQMNIPTVLLDSFLGWPLVDVVACENRQGGLAATRHLIEHGHQHIVALMGPAQWASTRERTEGYSEAMVSTALKPQVFHADATTVSTGAELTRQAFREQPQTTAIFTANDVMAIGSMSVLAEWGRRVGEDVAVIGFDDIAWARLSQPTLSTMKVYMAQMGKLAARRVLERIEGDDSPPVQVRLSADLVPRHSCGCGGTTPALHDEVLGRSQTIST